MELQAYIYGNNLCEIKQEVDGLVTVINDKEIPLHPISYPVVIVQPGKVKVDQKYKTEKGKLYVEGLDEGFDRLELIPITVFGRGRTLYEGVFKEGEKSVRTCWSLDGITPSKYVQNPPSDRCCEVVDGQYLKPVCPMAVWENGNKPPCGEYINVAFLAINLNCTPVHFQFQRTSIASFKQFQKMYIKKKNAVRIRNQSIYDYLVVATTSDEGTYYKPVFELEYRPEDNLKAYVPLCNWYLENVYKPIAEKRATDPLAEIEEPVEDSVNTTESVDGDFEL